MLVVNLHILLPRALLGGLVVLAILLAFGFAMLVAGAVVGVAGGLVHGDSSAEEDRTVAWPM